MAQRVGISPINIYTGLYKAGTDNLVLVAAEQVNVPPNSYQKTLCVTDRRPLLAGYGVIRPCRSGYKIGPLFADRPELAEQLFRALKTSVPNGSPVYLDIPESNSAAIDLVQRHGMQVVFKTARMYMGQQPDLCIDRIFGITTFELG